MKPRKTTTAPDTLTPEDQFVLAGWMFQGTDPEPDYVAKNIRAEIDAVDILSGTYDTASMDAAVIAACICASQEMDQGDRQQGFAPPIECVLPRLIGAYNELGKVIANITARMTPEAVKSLTPTDVEATPQAPTPPHGIAPETADDLMNALENTLLSCKSGIIAMSPEDQRTRWALVERARAEAKAAEPIESTTDENCTTRIDSHAGMTVITTDATGTQCLANMAKLFRAVVRDDMWDNFDVPGIAEHLHETNQLAGFLEDAT